MKKIRYGGPWLCMDSFFLMHEWCSDLAPEEFRMNRLGVLAKMHNLPVGAVLNEKECGEKLVGNIGKFIKVGQSELEGARKWFIRVRVEIEIDKPLVTGFFLRRLNRDPLWVNLNYERLPGSCSKCGRLNHDSEKCTYAIDTMQAQLKEVAGDSMEKQRTGRPRGLANGELTEDGERKEPKSDQNPEKDATMSATSKAGYRKVTGVGLEVDIHDKANEKATCGSLMDVDELDRLAEEINISHSPKRVQKTYNCDGTERTVGSSSKMKDVWHDVNVVWCGLRKDTDQETNISHSPKSVSKTYNCDGTERTIRTSSKMKDVWHDVNVVWCGLRKDTDASGSNMMLGPIVISPISDSIGAKPKGDRVGSLDGGWEAGVSLGYGRSKVRRKKWGPGQKPSARFHPYQGSVSCLQTIPELAQRESGNVTDSDIILSSAEAAHIDVRVRSDSEFFLTLFYGSPRCNERKASWDLLRRLRKDGGEPWVVMGDFNEILFSWEMESKRNRQAWQMRNFRQCLVDCGLVALGFSGNRFTYTNKRREEEEVKARLDRVVANNDWRARFPKAAVRHVFANSSNHVPGRRNSKRLEPMWLRHMEFKEKVRTSWVVQTEGLQLKEKLKACMSQLARWNGSVFGRMKDKIRHLKEEIQQIREGSEFI
ncbi:hypothetical protein QQ045_001813 [Rhodiola kirilowii]